MVGYKPFTRKDFCYLWLWSNSYQNRWPIKTKRVKGTMDKSITEKIGQHITIELALAAYYLSGIKCRKNDLLIR